MKGAISPRRQHPLAILRYVARYSLLLTVLLVRGWPKSAIVLVLIGIPVFSWFRQTFCVTERAFCLRGGLLWRWTVTIPRRHISTLTVERPLYLRLFHAARIRLDTDSSAKKRPVLSLLVSERVARRILDQRQKQESQPLARFSPRPVSVIGLSLLISDSLSGVIFLATMIYQVGRLLGEQYARILLDNLESAADYIRIFPRTAAIIGLVLVIGWCMAAGRNLWRNLPFHITRHRAVLSISAGWLNRREYSCTVRSINYLDIRQTLPSKILRLSIVFIHCIGYGRSRGMLSLLLPAMASAKVIVKAKDVLPELRCAVRSIKPVRRALWRYSRYPVMALLSIYPVVRSCVQFMPAWQDLLILFGCAACIPCLWWLAVSIVEYYTAGLAYENACLTLTYARRFTFHTLVIPLDKMVCVRMRQSVLQRRHDTVDVFIYTLSKRKCCHRICALPATEVATLFNKTRKVV